MGPQTNLAGYLERSARVAADRPAVEESGGQTVSYGELDRLAERVRRYLVAAGVRRGDRVGVYLRKSIDSVAAVFGILKAGAAYVPVDPGAPPRRNGFILADCGVHAVFVETRFVRELREALAPIEPALLELEGVGGGAPLVAALGERAAADAPSTVPGPGDLAYILYTSGSTGRPKGVMLSHGNALSFIEWCAATFRPRAEDRFSSHAPLHFDLSILDLYLAVRSAATLVLVDEELGKDPVRLAPFIADRQLSVWYSAPSILSLLAQYGNLRAHDLSSLRLVLFAGEVFPVQHLRRLKGLLPEPRYFNLYGPTETNVCTFHEIPKRIPEDRRHPYPIGTACRHLEARVIDGTGAPTPLGSEGELLISGPSVMQGYWNLPDRTAAAFLEDGEHRWYRTGDLVVESRPGVFTFIGRRDRMVKRRGYRIELGEIEAALYRHPDLSEAAVVAASGDDGVVLRAFYSTRNGERLSVVRLKRFCSEELPRYMIPDRFEFLPALPRTSTDKVDYQRLEEHS